MTNAKLGVLAPILARVRRDNHAMKGPDGVLCIKKPLTDELIEAHLAGGTPRGVYLIAPGESTCRAAVFDLDSHKGATSWPVMTAAAMRLFNACEALGLKPNVLRSTGGSGGHLWMLWGDPQDAYSVRQLMRKALADAGMRPGTGSVANGEVEVFPKQDSVDVGKWGNMVILPFAGKSEMLDPTFDLELAIPLEEVVWRGSDPVPAVEKPVRPPVVATGNLAEYRDALAATPIDTFGYSEWRDTVFALHFESGGSEEGFAVADEFSARFDTYDEDQLRSYWDNADTGKQGGVTGASILFRARQAGWNEITAESFAVVVGEPEGQERIPPMRVLDPKDSMGLARATSRARDVPLLRTSHLWYEHAGPCWVEVPNDEVKAGVWTFLDSCQKEVTVRVQGKGKITAIERFCPTLAQVTGTLDALRAVAGMRGVVAPCWLPGYEGPDPREIVSLSDGLLHITNRTLLPHTAGLFALNTLPFAWGSGDGEPTEWLQFLEAVWPGDREAHQALQDMFGYLLTADTRQQKMFLIRGPKRSGKGTIGRVLGALLGRENIVSPTLTSLTSNFGLQPLIGKLVALIPDARVGVQTNTQSVVEKLLMVSGEDSVTVDRKNKEAWTGTLAARIVIMTNEVPQLGDASGALAGRFINISMDQSFSGREDLGLTERLIAELPGIFRWALDGRDRLKARGYFVQPASAQEDAEELAESNSPITIFFTEVMEEGAEFTVTISDAFEAWQTWCGQNGRSHAGTKQTFGKAMRTAYRHVRVRKLWNGGARVMEYAGIRIRPHIRAEMGLFQSA